MSLILYLKAFHIIGFVAWFAGLFYLVRIFVYHTEALDKPEPEKTILTKQYNLMAWRVYKIICNPAMMITWICGLSMLYIYGIEWLKMSTWIHLKLFLLVLLVLYHLYCKKIIQKLEQNQPTFSAFQFRLLNEAPTLFLVAIVLLAVLRNSLNFFYAFLGIFLFGFVLYLIAKGYKKYREG